MIQADFTHHLRRNPNLLNMDLPAQRTPGQEQMTGLALEEGDCGISFKRCAHDCACITIHTRGQINRQKFDLFLFDEGIDGLDQDCRWLIKSACQSGAE